MKISKNFFLLIIGFMQLANGKCNRTDHAHRNQNVVHCPYQQEDIFRCYREKTGCYKKEQRRKECFFCGCPIEEHTQLKCNPADASSKLWRAGKTKSKSKGKKK
jgi:hypothetical protein